MELIRKRINSVELLEYRPRSTAARIESADSICVYEDTYRLKTNQRHHRHGIDDLHEQMKGGTEGQGAHQELEGAGQGEWECRADPSEIYKL